MTLKAWSQKFEKNTKTSKFCRALATLTIEQLPLCQNCIQRITKRSFTAKGVIAEGCLDLIHLDVYGSFSVHARGG